MAVLSFLKKLAAPEISRLESELSKTTLQRDWARELLAVANADREQAVKALNEERKRHLKREDSMQATIIKLSTGGKGLMPPPTIAEPEQPQLEEVSLVSPMQSALEDSILRTRAEEYVAQKGGDVEEVYKLFKEDPQNWLSN